MKLDFIDIVPQLNDQPPLLLILIYKDIHQTGISEIQCFADSRWGLRR